MGLLRTLMIFCHKGLFCFGGSSYYPNDFWMYSFLLVLVKECSFGIVENLKGFVIKDYFVLWGSSYYQNDFWMYSFYRLL